MKQMKIVLGAALEWLVAMLIAGGCILLAMFISGLALALP